MRIEKNLENLKLSFNQYKILQLLYFFRQFNGIDHFFKIVYMSQCRFKDDPIFDYKFYRGRSYSCFSNDLRADVSYLVSNGIVHLSPGLMSFNLSREERKKLISHNSRWNAFSKEKNMLPKDFDKMFYRFSKMSEYEIGDSLILV